MTFRYIGSKARVVEEIFKRIGSPTDGSRFVDLFCGTGAVSEAAAALGWSVHLNDHLNSAVIMASARMTSRSAVPFRAIGGYEEAIRQLNTVLPRQGFIYREYSPASLARAGLERRYFTKENAAAIDGARSLIGAWTSKGLLTLAEERLLLADLLSATNRIANIAGTYGCFLSTWQKQALDTIELRPRTLPASGGTVTTSTLDATAVPVGSNDVVYLDPPYTKRQYAAYYHLLETIALGDEPIVEGVTGLRPWRDKASDFCYRTRALGALTALVQKLPSRRIVISYSDDAHIPIDELISAMRTIGKVTPSQLKEVGRYRPNKVAGQGQTSVSEYLIEVERASERVDA